MPAWLMDFRDNKTDRKDDKNLKGCIYKAEVDNNRNFCYKSE